MAARLKLTFKGRLSPLLLYVNPPRPNQISLGGESQTIPGATLEFVIQTGPHNVPLIVRFEPKIAGLARPKEPCPTEILIVERVIEVLRFDRPVTADHALNTAAHGPAPNEIFFVGINR